ncbi:MmcQ/YjbR family DNA-binding protein [Streptococcus pneumoniae]
MVEMLEIFKGYEVDENQLELYGFHKEKDSYTYAQTILEGEFLVRIGISGRDISLQVLDSETQEIYAPFWVENVTGTFVGQVRQEVAELLLEIRESCFQANRFLHAQTERILERIAASYHGKIDYLWERLGPHTAYPAGALRHQKTKKWYGIVMTLDWKKFYANKEGKIEILTLKHDEVATLLKTEGYYPAYHMNKKYWLSIPLNDSISDQAIFELIERSYSLTQ